MFPAILVTLTRHVTSRGSHDVIIGSLLTFRLLSSSFCPRNIKKEFHRHPDNVTRRPPVYSDLCPPWLVRNWTWKLFLWMDSREYDYLQRMIFCLLSQQPRYSSGDTSRDISSRVMWQYTTEKMQRRLISERAIENITSNLSCTHTWLILWGCS